MSIPRDRRTYSQSPCPFVPGTTGKQRALTARATRGLPLFRSDDATLGERDGYAGGPLTGTNALIRLVREGDVTPCPE